MYKPLICTHLYDVISYDEHTSIFGIWRIKALEWDSPCLGHLSLLMSGLEGQMFGV